MRRRKGKRRRERRERSCATILVRVHGSQSGYAVVCLWEIPHKTIMRYRYLDKPSMVRNESGHLGEPVETGNITLSISLFLLKMN